MVYRAPPSICVMTEASAKKKKEAKGEEAKGEDTLKNAEASIASVKETLAAIDDLDRRWKDVQRRFGEALSISLQSAFGIEAPSRLTDAEKQEVLGGSPSIETLCKRLKAGQYKNIVVMVGAGVSVAAGIPDFRSPESGFYETLDIKKFNLPSPQSVFDIAYFEKDPRPFFAIAKEFYPGKYKPTPAHYFIRLLADKGFLLRCYTQNIDALERAAGLQEEHLVEAHGSFAKAKCTSIACGKECDNQQVKAAIFADEIPYCPECSEGVVKPCVVFFGEPLPERFKDLYESDLTACDLLIVMGTSLQVQPFAGLTHRVKESTPRLLINKERVGTFTLASEGGYRDIALLEDCNTAVERVCKLCHWDDQLHKMMAAGMSDITRTKKGVPSVTTNKCRK